MPTPTHDDLLFAAKVAATPLPHQDHPQYNTLLRAQAQAEIKRREVRELALFHLYDFATLVLGYSDFYEPLHRPLAEHTERPEETLTLLPRGVFKSTVSSVAYPLWLLIKFPDTRVLLCNSGLTNPRKWIREQKDHLTSNAVLRWVFPESVPAYEDVQQFGFTESFTIPNRTPGCPWDEHLDRELFTSLLEAQVVTEDWRIEYNTYRPHGALGLETPSEFAASCIQAALAPLEQPGCTRELEAALT